jgi:hypothetical protein
MATSTGNLLVNDNMRVHAGKKAPGYMHVLLG